MEQVARIRNLPNERHTKYVPEQSTTARRGRIY